jgi:outer membrane protein assembly factor BamB
MRTVDLDEDETEPMPHAEPRSRRRMLVGLAVVGVAVLTAVVGQRTVDARHEAELAALANVPGVLAPIDERLEVTRRISGEDLPTAFGPNGSLERAADGSQSYVWRAKGGSPLWTTALLGPKPALSNRFEVYAGTSCIPETEGNYPYDWDLNGARRVACLVSDGGSTFADGDGEQTVVVPATSLEMVVLRTADGSIEARWPLEHGEILTLLPGVVVVQWMDRYDVRVEARDLRTGAVLWSRRVAGTAVPGIEHASGSISTVGDLVVVDGVDGRLVALTPDGEVVVDVMPEPERGYVDRTIDASGRLFLYDIDPDGSSITTLVAPDGDPARNRSVSGAVVSLSVDDGSAADLFLTGDEGLAAWDGATGDQLWTYASSTSTAIVLAGHVYAVTGDGVVALDADTGEEVWHSVVDDASSYGSLFTDGHHILVEKNSGGRGLIALDRETGEEQFRAQYPTEAADLYAMGHQLVGYLYETGAFLVIE